VIKVEGKKKGSFIRSWPLQGEREFIARILPGSGQERGEEKGAGGKVCLHAEGQEGRKAKVSGKGNHVRRVVSELGPFPLIYS